MTDNIEVKRKRGRPRKIENFKIKRGRPPKIQNVEIKRKRGRPPKSKIKTNTFIVNNDLNVTNLELWKLGKNQKFKIGNVVERGNNIGVIFNIGDNYKEYHIKWHTGTPNKWDYIEGIGIEDTLKLSNKPNPLLVDSWDRYPGPSSDLIRKIEEKRKKQIEEMQKNKSAKDVDKIVESIEESHKKLKYISEDLPEEIDEEKHDDDIDIVVDASTESEEIEIIQDLSVEEMYRKIKEELEDI